MMAIYLEEAAEVLFGALQIGTPIPLTLDESKQRQIEALPPVDLERAWNFFKTKIASENWPQKTQKKSRKGGRM